MQPNLLKILPALAVALALAMPGAAMAENESEKRIKALYGAAKKEGEVIFYTTGRKSYNKSFSKAWKNNFPGVKLTLLRKNSPKLIQTVAAEMAAGAPRPDVVNYAAPHVAQIWKEKGWYVPYKPATFDQISPLFKDKDGNWVSKNVFLMLGAYNPDLIKDTSKLPKKFADLLDPRWKDKLLSAHPSTAGSSRTFYATVVRKNLAGGWAFLEKLGKQNLFYTKGNSGAARMVVAGERPLAVAISSGNIVVAMDKGQKIKWFAYEDGAIINHGPMGIMKWAKHPNAARLLVEWVMSPEGQNKEAEWGKQWGSVKGANPPAGMPPLASFNLIEPDLAWMVKNQKAFLEKFGTLMDKRN